MSNFVAKLEVDRNPVLAVAQLPKTVPEKREICFDRLAFSDTRSGVVPQPAQEKVQEKNVGRAPIAVYFCH